MRTPLWKPTAVFFSVSFDVWRAYYIRVIDMKKDEEKKPLSWEAADPKLPVIQSGRMENRICNQNRKG